MSKAFAPNVRGLVPVKMVKSYGSNVTGETAGFLPAVAKELVRKGIATLPGQPATASEASVDSAEMTTRQFRQKADPLDHDGDGKKGGSKPAPERSGLDDLRDEYRTVVGSDPDARWGAARIAAEIDKFRDAAAAHTAEGQSDEGAGAVDGEGAGGE